ncbi:hypothetical protein H6G81_05970 [Scytonema hofmannii FACHB-248]|uniref:Uncharacterized protein n=1 Tax=Scytonema hofmannii FACHB-248 TaxID=1842502 RepID=A0ABR8GL20_9CYAN|nr:MULTISPECIES: hypothetical protein [Nostocales]MBD2604082.1 hypothetical protein [Scytonema hofmannii FACHB-248]
MKNFTISLYAFHLRQTFTDAPDEVVADAKLLWENLVKLGESSLPFPGLRDLRSKLICYQNGKYEPKREQGRETEWLTDSGSLDLGSIPTVEGFKINANLQPFRFNDTYAIDLTLSPESPNISIDVQQLQLFKPGCLLPSKIQASLGHTLWIYGEVDASEDCQELANKFAVALLAGTYLNPVLVNEDKLFGSLLFEYQVSDPNHTHNSANHCNILVWLNNSQANSLTLSGRAYDWLLNLLISRHKIRYIYQEACNCYSKALKLYSRLDKQMQQFPSLIADPKTRLEKLKELLKEIPLDAVNYNRCLGDLKAHHTAITTNTTNYVTCLGKITAIGDRPQFWEDFLNLECKRKQNQIQIYIDYLSPGQDLFGQMIDTIRGTVELEQAQSDRTNESAAQKRQQRLERLITFIGTALAVSGVTSQVAPNPIKTFLVQPTKNKPSDIPELPSYISYSFFEVLIHIVIGVLLAIPVYFLVKWRQQRSKCDN